MIEARVFSTTHAKVSSSARVHRTVLCAHEHLSHTCSSYIPDMGYGFVTEFVIIYYFHAA